MRMNNVIKLAMLFSKKPDSLFDSLMNCVSVVQKRKNCAELHLPSKPNSQLLWEKFLFHAQNQHCHIKKSAAIRTNSAKRKIVGQVSRFFRVWFKPKIE